MDNIKYLKEESTKGSIVTRVFNGNISKQDILTSFKFMISDNLLNTNSIGLITVISNSTIKMDVADIENIVTFMSIKY